MALFLKYWTENRQTLSSNAHQSLWEPDWNLCSPNNVQPHRNFKNWIDVNSQKKIQYMIKQLFRDE